MAFGTNTVITTSGTTVAASQNNGPFFPIAYFLPVYDHRIDTNIHSDTDSGVHTSAIEISASFSESDIFSSISADTDQEILYNIGDNATYSYDEDSPYYLVNDASSFNATSVTAASQKTYGPVNFYNSQPISNVLSATSLNVTDSDAGNYSGTGIAAVAGATNSLPSFFANFRSSLFTVNTYTPISSGGATARGLFKIRLDSSTGDYKFNKILLFIQRYGTDGEIDTSFTPVLYAIVGFGTVVKKKTGFGITNFELDVELEFDSSEVYANVTYLNSDYWTKLPPSSTSATDHGLNYSGNVSIGTSADPGSWFPEAKLEVTEQTIPQFRLSYDSDDFSDFYTTSANELQIRTSAVSMGSGNTSTGDYSITMGKDCSATGTGSFSVGRISQATGEYCLAFGYQTTADADYSFSFGEETLANNTNGFAGGYRTSATGAVSFVYGDSTIAAGGNSVAFGFGSKAESDNSFAFGFITCASGDQAVAIGKFSSAYGESSFATGESTCAAGNYSIAGGNASLASGLYSFAHGLNCEAKGVNSFAFGDGCISSTSTGTITFGKNTSASNSYALAFGYGSLASGQYSSTFGLDTVSTGSYSTSFGSTTSATDSYSFAAGSSTLASGIASFSMGHNNISSGDYSMSVGNNAKATGSGALAIGFQTSAGGSYSSSIGYETSASGNYSLAMGYSNNAFGIGSVAIGYDNDSTGDYSVTLGRGCDSTGTDSIAIGQASNARETNAIAIGYGCQSLGSKSIVLGKSGFSLGENSVVISTGSGGIGTRSNALEIVGSGGLYIKSSNLYLENGNLEVTGSIDSTTTINAGSYITEYDRTAAQGVWVSTTDTSVFSIAYVSRQYDGSLASGDATPDTLNMRYTLIGKTCMLSLRITYSSHSNDAYKLTMQGLNISFGGTEILSKSSVSFSGSGTYDSSNTHPKFPCSCEIGNNTITVWSKDNAVPLIPTSGNSDINISLVFEIN